MTRGRFRALLPAAAFLSAFLAGCADSKQKPAAAQQSSPAAAEPVRAVAAAPLRVGSWNIEWLGMPENRSAPAKGQAQNPEDLAEYIMAANVAVLGVAEVARSDESTPWANDTLTKTFEIINARTGSRWQHQLIPALSGRNQLCGIAWDGARVRPTGELQAAIDLAQNGTADKPLWSRPPPGLKFTTGLAQTDFVMIMVHMKSNSDGNHAERRGEEARRLVADAPRIFQDGDLLIMGDSNCIHHGEPAVAVFQEAGWVDLNAGDVRTFWRGDGALDRAFVPVGQPEFALRHFEVFGEPYLKQHNLTPAEFKKRFSDHYMVITEITVGPDDD